MHTPGPWRLVDGKSEVIAGDCYHVAFVKAWFPEHAKQQEANARLIAAAPEMLDVLKLARVMLDAMIASSKGNIHDHCISTARRIDEVIQKVTGTDAAKTSAIGGES
jgi:hypothetical protein